MVLRVNHPIRSATMEYLSRREGHSIQEERTGKFGGRNAQVILKNRIVATLCKVLPV